MTAPVNQGVINALITSVHNMRAELAERAKTLAAIEGQQKALAKEYRDMASETQNLVEAIRSMGGPDLDAD